MLPTRPLSLAFLVGFGLTTVLASAALAQTKTYGFDDSKTGGGIGVQFSPAEVTAINATLDKIAALGSYSIKGTTVDCAEVAKDLRKMLNDGRMGKGKDARGNVNASTQRDDKTTADGDRMNISDHFLDSATNAELGSVLVHEWLHTHQHDTTKPEREAPAYQVGSVMYLLKGGGDSDAPFNSSISQTVKFKNMITTTTPTLPDHKTPSGGDDHCDCDDVSDMFLGQQPSKLYMWSGVTATDSLFPSTVKRMFFSVNHLKQRGSTEYLFVTGCDTTTPSAPVGVVTMLQSNGTHFISRTDVVLSGVHYPLSAASSPDRHRVYLLDTFAAAPAVWIYQDVNGDSLPDNLLPTPFATNTSAGVANALGIISNGIVGGQPSVLLSTLDRRGIDDLTLSDPVTQLIDTNNDGLADVSVPTVFGQFIDFGPTLATEPNTGMTSLDVFGVNGHTIQVRATDATGNVNLGALGSVVASGFVPVGVTLSRSLNNGEYVMPVDLTANTRPSAPEQVVNAAPALAPPWLAGCALLLAAAATVQLRRRKRPALG